MPRKKKTRSTPPQETEFDREDQLAHELRRLRDLIYLAASRSEPTYPEDEGLWWLAYGIAKEASEKFEGDFMRLVAYGIQFPPSSYEVDGGVVYFDEYGRATFVPRHLVDQISAKAVQERLVATPAAERPANEIP